MQRSLRLLQGAFEEKGIQAWVDFWGHDVNHDWPWWRRHGYFCPGCWPERAFLRIR